MLSEALRTNMRCPVCKGPLSSAVTAYSCDRCGKQIADEPILNLLPEKLSVNNEREEAAFDADTMDIWRSVGKPYNAHSSYRMHYLEQAKLIRQFALDIWEGASILYLFSGAGMEAHISGIMNENTVLSDISRTALRFSQQRVESYRLPTPAAYIQADAESLPFEDDAFDIVIAFDGIHHCLVPQQALTECWRVAKRRLLVLDNWQCLLTDVLFRMNLSSKIEYSGLRPNRFNRIMLDTMLGNEKFERYLTIPVIITPSNIERYLTSPVTRAIEYGLLSLGQANQFMLVLDWTDADLQALQHAPALAFDANPTNFMPSAETPIIPG